MSHTNNALVGIAMGSESDWPVMKDAVEILDSFGIPSEARVLSAHRTPVKMTEYAEQAVSRGLRVIIAGAGGAAHLPGMIAASTPLPVIGVPVPTRHLKGMDSLLSIVQMPRGVPVATFAIGEAGAANAALFAVAMLASGGNGADSMLTDKLDAFRLRQADKVAAMQLPKPE